VRACKGGPTNFPEKFVCDIRFKVYKMQRNYILKKKKKKKKEKEKEEENRFLFIMAQAKPHPNILLNFNFSLYILNLISKSKFHIFQF
jgi:hypothetical protein